MPMTWRSKAWHERWYTTGALWDGLSCGRDARSGIIRRWVLQLGHRQIISDPAGSAGLPPFVVLP